MTAPDPYWTTRILASRTAGSPLTRIRPINDGCHCRWRDVIQEKPRIRRSEIDGAVREWIAGSRDMEFHRAAENCRAVGNRRNRLRGEAGSILAAGKERRQSDEQRRKRLGEKMPGAHMIRTPKHILDPITGKPFTLTKRSKGLELGPSAARRLGEGGAPPLPRSRGRGMAGVRRNDRRDPGLNPKNNCGRAKIIDSSAAPCLTR